MYADDLLLYISDPISCVQNIVEILHTFGSFSVYKLNFSKSECFPVNRPALQISDSDLPFRLNKSGIRYLGINITSSMSSLYKHNFVPLVSKLKLDFQKWNVIHLSLAGRINCIKMNVLSRFLYLFQCLPIFLPKSFFLKSHFYGVARSLEYVKNYFKDLDPRVVLHSQTLCIITGPQICKKLYTGCSSHRQNGAKLNLALVH